MNIYKNFSKNPFTLFLFLIFITVLSSCSSSPAVSDYPPTAVPADEIAKFENDLKSARLNQLDVLSPDNFRVAEDSLEEAKNNFLKGKNPQQTLHKVAVGRAYLMKAQSISNNTRISVDDAIVAREAALKANARTYFSREFKNVDKHLASITSAYEKNKTNSISLASNKLKEKYRDLELRSISEKHLSESRYTIALAKKENAHKYAPRTLAIAESKLNETQLYINENPYATKEIILKARETRNAANRALNVNRFAKSTDKVSTEEIALLMEKEREKIKP